jgi:hypothetical protein
VSGPAGPRGTDLHPPAQPALNHPIVITRHEGHDMLLMHEDLARAHLEQRLADAARAERRHSMVLALRAQRRAKEAAVRARHLLAVAAAR